MNTVLSCCRVPEEETAEAPHEVGGDAVQVRIHSRKPA
jgi:hypothetical protein